MGETFNTICFLLTLLFVICYVIIKISNFRRNNGYNRIFKKEINKNKK